MPRRRRRADRCAAAGALLALLPALGACHVGGAIETPLAGAAPDAVLVLPPRDVSGELHADLRDVAVGVDAAMRERGYRTLPLELGFDFARRAGVAGDADPSLAELAALERTAGVDAVLVLDVATWDVTMATARSRPGAVAWNLTWRLLATRDGATLWQHRGDGRWHRAPAEHVDLLRAPDAEPGLVWIGDDRLPDFRSVRELATTLHRAAMAALPRRPR